MTLDTDDPTPALGTIVDEGRGALPYQLIHGESLVACAAWALGGARVTAVDLGTPWSEIAGSGEAFVLHDALCPMTPAAFISECVEDAVRSGCVVVGVDEAGHVLSPVVIPTQVLAGLEGLPSTDFDELAPSLDARSGVERRFAPPTAARVASAEDVAALERLTSPEPDVEER
jgi:2-C-methyl-D-erythritol 4-phosphate cytidylyltransferase